MLSGRVFLAIALLLFFYWLLELAGIFFSIKTIFTRKAAHVISGLSAVWLLFWLSYYDFIFLLVFFTLVFVFAWRIRLFKSIHLPDVKNLGEIYFPLGLLSVVVFFYFDKPAAIAGLLVLAISDTLAGMSVLFHKKTTKTWIGGLVFFLSAFLILFSVQIYFGFLITPVVVFKTALIAFWGAVVEFFSPQGSDNLTIPFFTAIAYKILF